ncbi:MAG: acyl-CoA thioesterase [Tessaracoccus sp.]|uniref:acyl-CoA thioesterase n=1 Tax=Tessaracoccus sp. TaxID=1971211 RepID=UPI001EC01F36|nr:thioesterase family protein [Tessaracoccus sp.]MBK7820915.1 acyl-CoA thioesterase [Tessaracoccus sp.]
MFVVECPLRWSDLDAQGHVNNAVIVDYLQEARVAFLRRGPASDLLDSGIIVVSHQVEFRGSISYETGAVRVELGVSALGAARLEIAYRVFASEGAGAAREVVAARTVLCPFDFDLQRPVRLRPEYRAFLQEHRIDAEPFRELAAPGLDGRATAVPLFVRWTDLDAYGHVNNAKVYDYLQQARVTATTAWDPTMARAGAEGSEHLWLVARQDVDYIAQIEHRLEPYATRIAPVRLGTSSLTLAAEIIDGDSVLARGRTVLVCADKDFRPVPLTEEMRATLGSYIVESGV